MSKIYLYVYDRITAVDDIKCVVWVHLRGAINNFKLNGAFASNGSLKCK
jgi:hypothetical protein